MKLTIILFLFTSACAHSGFQAICADRQLSPETVEYPNGEQVKSDVIKCNDGCVKFQDVNDPNTTFNSCDREAGQ